MASKAQLAVALSRVSVFEKPDFKARQYPTESETAADILWRAYMLGDIKNKVIADLGAGTGILGIGCLLLGADKVLFVEKDRDAIERLKENLADFEPDLFEIANMNINDFHSKADVVVQNPPFDTEKEHADRAFLVKAFNTADIIYSLHTAASKAFINALCRDSGFKVTHCFEYKMPLARSMDFHAKKSKKIDVTCFRLKKN